MDNPGEFLIGLKELEGKEIDPVRLIAVMSVVILCIVIFALFSYFDRKTK